MSFTLFHDMGIFTSLAQHLGLHYTALLTLLGGTALLLLISRAVARLYFHPLSRFPGPSLAALTDYYVSWYIIFKDGAWVAQLQNLHDRYGACIVK